MLTGDLQAKINPAIPGGVLELNPAPAANPNAPVKDKTGDIDFLKVMTESNEGTKKEREAKKNGDLSSAKTYEEMLEKLAEQQVTRRDPKHVLNKDDFLKLFVTQLQNQDPLNPDDGAEMASKLAQFNSLEQMLNVNTTLEKMFKQQTNTRNTELINYVGKEVTINGGRVRLKAGALTESTYHVKSPSTQTGLEVRDSAGVLVYAQDLGNVAEGEHKLAWHGKNKEGQPLPDGIYTFNITAKGINNEPVPVEITTPAKITGVDIKDLDGGLYTNLGVVKLDAVKAIGQAGFTEVKAPLKDKEAADAAANKTGVKPVTQPQPPIPAQPMAVQPLPVQPLPQVQTTTVPAMTQPPVAPVQPGQVVVPPAVMAQENTPPTLPKELPEQPASPQLPGT